ncbi:SDR family oxidoreductase [Caulobacter sp. RL271]|uniref:SDR family oxidoreductase n=1 Tax=Caulobacter segnis TaxID=88688 RepID=A0ABY4ZUT5_9CAUL|nr:SDR family oxidoreductase [Caulobacter segnis]USQ96425.1 SDR family oxidoreductase [Caulobacter segnis]
MTIAVTGSTGQLGRLVIEKLKARVPAGEIIALARDPAKAADLVRVADYAKPETLATALAGVDTLLLISSDAVGQRVAQHAAVIDAAKAAGVKRIAYTSILRGDASPLVLADEHKATEALIKASGLTYALLRNGWYTENYTGSLAGAVAAGAMIGASGEGKISAAPREDYAEAAAVVISTPDTESRVYELAGDTAFTRAELAAEVSRQTGKTIPYNDLPEAEYARILESFGLPAPFAAVLAQSDIGAAQGGLFDDSRTLSGLIGRPTTPLATAVAAALAG